MKVDPVMYNRTAQLIDLVSHLDDDDPVDPTWTDFRKQYYPHEDSYWEYFNLKFNDTEKPLDLYMDLVKPLIETNQKGITGTKQEFATTLGTAPMRRRIRRQRIRNPHVLEQYRRKSKKEGRSTSSSSGDDDDDSDNDSDESLGYRRSFGTQEDNHDRLETMRRMIEDESVSVMAAPMRKKIRRQGTRNPEVFKMNRRKPKKESTSSLSEGTYEKYDRAARRLGYRRTFVSQDDYSTRRMLDVDKIWPDARVSELNFKKVPSFEEETTYLRSLYVGEKNDVSNKKDDEWDSPKKSISWNNQDTWDKPKINDLRRPKNLESIGKIKDTHKIDWEELTVERKEGREEKGNELKKNEWDNLGHKKYIKNKEEHNDEVWIKNKETSRDDRSLKTDAWEKQGRDKKKTEKDWSKYEQKINKWDTDDDMNKPKKAKVKDREQFSTTQKKKNDNNKQKFNDGGWLESKKKDIWDSYGNKKIKEYDENVSIKEKKNERVKDNKRESLGKKGWDDDYTPQKDKHDDKADLRTKNKNNERHNIGWSDKDSWEIKPKKKKEVWGNRSTKGDYDNNSNKKSAWDNKPTKKDSWEDKLEKKDSWDEKPKKKNNWDSKPVKKGIWDDERINNDNSYGWNGKLVKKEKWNDKPVKKESWNDKPVKKESWNDKPVKKDRWDDKPKKDSWDIETTKNKKGDEWDDQSEKSTRRWREDKTTRDWDPPPTRKKKYVDDSYERPRNKYAKRDRDTLNVRTPIPFVGKRGIYEDI